MSLQNLLITKLVLPLRPSTRRLASAERTRRHIAARAARPARYKPPRLLARRATIRLRRDHAWPVYELSPRAAASVRHVLYLHGGAFINEIVRSHWSLLGELVQRVPCRCVVPIYRLVPHATAAEMVADVIDVAAELVDDAGGDDVVLMGDSAGGGLALAAAQALRDRGARVRRIVLIAPWLDVALADPEQREIEPRDAMLAIPGLAEAARQYAGELPLDDPRASPIHGDLRGLPPIAIFSGTDDLLNPDARRLRDACEQVGTAVELVQEEGMPHDYPLFPTPEGRAARRTIVELLRS